MKKLIFLGLIVLLIGFVWRSQTMTIYGLDLSPSAATIGYGETQTFSALTYSDVDTANFYWYLDGVLVKEDLGVIYPDFLPSEYTTSSSLSLGTHQIRVWGDDSQGNSLEAYATLTVTSGSPSPSPGVGEGTLTGTITSSLNGKPVRDALVT